MKISREKVDKLMLRRGIVEYRELARRADITPKHLSAVLCRGTCPPRTAAKIADALGVHVPAVTAEDKPAISWKPPTPEEFALDCLSKGLPVPALEPAPVPDPAVKRILEKAFATTPDPIWETDPAGMERTILEFIGKPVPEKWRYWGLRERLAFWRGRGQGEHLAPRDRVCAAEVWQEALDRPVQGMARKDVQKINAIIAAAPDWEMADLPLRFGPYGKCRGFVRRNVPFSE